MPSLRSLVCCAIGVSITVGALRVASAGGQKPPRKSPRGLAAPPHPRMALAAGQTIIGVEETATVLRFYLGHTPRAAGEAA
jgi:hypothetical protein